jgi:hypothetical protein
VFVLRTNDDVAIAEEIGINRRLTASRPAGWPHGDNPDGPPPPEPPEMASNLAAIRFAVVGAPWLFSEARF